MVSIKWCLKQKNGIELIDPNENMSDSYLKMAEESIETLNKVQESKIWTASTTYYTFYYSLYSLMLRIGVKCEIHSCSIEFMKRFLACFYNKIDMNMFEEAFSTRINLQYYFNMPVDKLRVEELKKYCKNFFIKTKDILFKITENQIEDIRDRLKKL